MTDEVFAKEEVMTNETLAGEVVVTNEPLAGVVGANEILAEEIYTYIKNELNHSSDFDSAASIVKEGIVDSMGILTLVSFLEKRYHVEIDFEEITPDNFKNIGAITRFIKKLLG